MRLVIQIPCFNEEATLNETINDLPEKIPGIDEIKILVIDDGSTDRTVEVAKAHPRVSKIVELDGHQGLAKAFKRGLEEALRMGADIIVNTDADNQYSGGDIEKLISPIISKRADMVIGDRNINSIPHFSRIKKILQNIGSYAVRIISKTNIRDATSGFRAYSRETAMKLNIFSSYTYTLETIIQAGLQGLRIEAAGIKTNRTTRESRLIRSIPNYVYRSILTMLEIFIIYNPIKFFSLISLFFFTPGLFLICRFFYFYFTVKGPTGYIQSLVISIALIMIGSLILLIGIVANLISTNRKLLEEMNRKLKLLEFRPEE
ncbi:MAG: glycosyltransferase family 2 protein [Nitrospirota bacterium]